MAETPPPPGAARLEAARTPEIREAPDHKTKVVDALNRTLDRAGKSNDELWGKVKSEGTGFITDDERDIMLGVQYAEGAISILTGGARRLNNDITETTIPVEVHDQETKQQYTRNEGIPIGYLLRFLQKEEKRAFHQMFEGGGEAARQEYRELWTDASILRNSARKTEYSFTSDYFGDILPEDIKTAAFKSPNINDHLMEKRVNEEAYLRSANPVIAEIGGETPEENYMRAHDDIADIRYELIIPEKGVPDPLDIYRATLPPRSQVAGTFDRSEVAPSTDSEASDAAIGTGVARVLPSWVATDDGRERPRDRYGALIPPAAASKTSTEELTPTEADEPATDSAAPVPRGTIYRPPSREDLPGWLTAGSSASSNANGDAGAGSRVDEPGDEVVPVFVPPLRRAGSERPRLFPEDQDSGTDVAEVRKVAHSSSEADGEPRRRRARLGILEEPDIDSDESEEPSSSEGVIIEGKARRITDADRAREERDDPLRDIVDKLKDTDWGGELKGRVRRFVGGLPKPGLKRALLVAGNLVGAAGVIVGGKMLIDQIRSNPTPEYDYGRLGAPQGVNVDQLPRGGVPSTIEPGSIPPWASRLPYNPESANRPAPRTGSFSQPPHGEVPMPGNNEGMPWDVRFVPPELRSIDRELPLPYQKFEVNIPGKGRKNLTLRLLTGYEPEVFNVPTTSPPATIRDGEPLPPTAISVNADRRAMEDPKLDKANAKTIQSYLDRETVARVYNLPKRNAKISGLGPEGEFLKSKFASLRGEFDAYWAEVNLGRKFDMRSPEDLRELDRLKNSPAYAEAWKTIVAGKLLNAPAYETVGFLTSGREITDIITYVYGSKGPEVPDVASLRFPKVPNNE